MIHDVKDKGKKEQVVLKNGKKVLLNKRWRGRNHNLEIDPYDYPGGTRNKFSFGVELHLA